MTRRGLAVMAMAIAAVLVCPRSTSAGFVDFIYEMSGPQFVGYGATFWFSRERPIDCSLCGIADVFHGRLPPPRAS